MAATIKFLVDGEDIQYPFEVEEINGEVSITKVVSALKMMRKMVDKTLTKHVEAEKSRRGKQIDTAKSSENMEQNDGDDEEYDDEEDDDDANDDDDDTRLNHCSPDSKKQKIQN